MAMFSSIGVGIIFSIYYGSNLEYESAPLFAESQSGAKAVAEQWLSKENYPEEWGYSIKPLKEYDFTKGGETVQVEEIPQDAELVGGDRYGNCLYQSGQGLYEEIQPLFIHPFQEARIKSLVLPKGTGDTLLRGLGYKL